MTRPLKFRAWNIQRQMFSYPGEGFSIRLDGVFMYGEEPAKNDYDIQQFTGLLDKRGVEIYEGDLLTTAWLKKRNEVRPTIVEYQPKRGAFRQVLDKDTSWVLSEAHIKEYGIEVIGNIHETPELLK